MAFHGCDHTSNGTQWSWVCAEQYVYISSMQKYQTVETLAVQIRTPEYSQSGLDNVTEKYFVEIYRNKQVDRIIA